MFVWVFMERVFCSWNRWFEFPMQWKLLDKTTALIFIDDRWPFGFSFDEFIVHNRRDETIVQFARPSVAYVFAKRKLLSQSRRIYTRLRSIEKWESVLTSLITYSLFMCMQQVQQWSLHRFPPYIWCRCRWCCVCYSICG